jgi:hypothetical protein
MHSRADFIAMVGRFGPKAQTPRASRSCPVRPQARRPVIFQPVPHGPARCVFSVNPPRSLRLLPSEFRSADDSHQRTPRLR